MRAFSMNSREPASMDPTGAPSAFDRQNITESNLRVMSATERPSAVAALKIRAPSRCTGIPAACARSQMSSATSSGYTVPPCMLCVLSSSIRPVWAR